MSCGVRCRRDSDLALLWLWYRLAAVAPIGPLAWELVKIQNLGVRIVAQWKQIRLGSMSMWVKDLVLP